MPPRSALGTMLGLWESERLRFLAVGAFNTAMGYGVFALLFLLLGQRIHYLAVGLLAHSIAVCIAFANHRLLVFRSREPWLGEFVRFNISLLGMLGLGMAALWLLVELGGLHPLLAQAIATPVILVLTYLVHRFFSFRQPQATRPPSR